MLKKIIIIAFVVSSMLVFPEKINKLIPAQICDKYIYIEYIDPVMAPQIYIAHRFFTIHFPGRIFVDIEVPDWVYYRYAIGDLIQVQLVPNTNGELKYEVVVEEGR